jgi:hypothetical protein
LLLLAQTSSGLQQPDRDALTLALFWFIGEEISNIHITFNTVSRTRWTGTIMGFQISSCIKLAGDNVD